MVFHLKRYRAEEGGGITKIDNDVFFTREVDMGLYTSDTNESLNYELYAVIQHSGDSTDQGHYTCFIRSAPQDWYMMDDARVTSISEELVMEKKAYILFYVIKGTPYILLKYCERCTV